MHHAEQREYADGRQQSRSGRRWWSDLTPYDRSATCCGLTRTEMLVTMVCVLIVVTLAVIVLHRFRTGPASFTVTMRDAEHIRQIHQGMLQAADERRDRYPQPGMIRRLPQEIRGELMFIPERGEPDPTQDTTANFYSLLVMKRYVGLDYLVSPGDPNPVIEEMDAYDYDLYHPNAGVHWDPAFQADLATGSNASYAHDLLYGRRARLFWRKGVEPHRPRLGTRGPEDGEPDPESYTCLADGSWRGVIVNGNNEYHFLQVMTPPGLFYGPDQLKQQDNIFRLDDGVEGEDVLLTFTRSVSVETGPTIQHD